MRWGTGQEVGQQEQGMRRPKFGVFFIPKIAAVSESEPESSLTCEVENRLFSLVSDAQTIRSPFKFMMVGLARVRVLGYVSVQ